VLLIQPGTGGARGDSWADHALGNVTVSPDIASFLREGAVSLSSRFSVVILEFFRSGPLSASELDRLEIMYHGGKLAISRKHSKRET